jgi:hypothetical protein
LHRLLHQPPDLREIEEFAWPHHAHCLILLPIEVSWSGVQSDDELRACGQGAFQETIVRLVPDDAQFGQRIADEKAIDDLNDEFRMIAQYIRVLLEDRRTDPRLNQVGVRGSKMSADALFSPGNVASFRMHVSRTTRKVWPGASQCARASLGFDERNRLAFCHRFAAVLAVCPRQPRGELEPDDLTFDDGRCIHNTSVCKEADGHKRRQSTTESMPFSCRFEDATSGNKRN